jgi:hypothetical protein
VAHGHVTVLGSHGDELGQESQRWWDAQRKKALAVDGTEDTLRRDLERERGRERDLEREYHDNVSNSSTRPMLAKGSAGALALPFSRRAASPNGAGVGREEGVEWLTSIWRRGSPDDEDVVGGGGDSLKRALRKWREREEKRERVEDNGVLRYSDLGFIQPDWWVNGQ